MSLVAGLGAAVGAAAAALSTPAILHAADGPHLARVSRQRVRLPLAALQTGMAYDARFHVHHLDLPVRPAPDDEIEHDGARWIVWSAEPSPAGSHTVADCIAQPATLLEPRRSEKVSDGAGGRTVQTVPAGDPFPAVVSSIGVANEAAGPNEVVAVRAVARWRKSDAPAGINEAWLLAIEGVEFRIMSMIGDDQNPAWVRAVLQRTR